MIPDWLAKARFRLIQENPYLATAVYALRPVATEKVPVAAVDRHGRLYYNPNISKTDTDIVAGIIEHEIWHLLRLHFERLTRWSKDIANLAADMEINDDIKLPLPSGAIYPSLFGFPRGLLAEEYAQMLEDKAEEFLEKIKKAAQAPAEGNCGSCATGRRTEWEEDEPEEQEQNAPGLTREDIEAIRRQVAEEITAKKYGNIPESIRRWAEQIIRPRIPWERLLAIAVRTAIAKEAGKTDFTFVRPSRRDTDPFIFPSLYRPSPKIAVVIDTSGSITDELLGKVLGVLDSIIKRFARSIIAIPCDEEPKGAFSVAKLSSIRDKCTGGGGTDMRKGIRKAIEEKADVVIVITDGDSPWEMTPPPTIPVIVVLVDGDRNLPQWAKKIIIEEGKK